MRRVFTLVMIFMFAFEVIPDCMDGQVFLKPLLKQDGLADASRQELSKYLYQRGVEMERSGNPAGALRSWIVVYNLDGGSETSRERFVEGYKMFYSVVDKKYREALFDLQYGRMDRAGENLRAAHDMLDGIDPVFGERVSKALGDLMGKEVR